MVVAGECAGGAKQRGEEKRRASENLESVRLFGEWTEDERGRDDGGVGV